jgi:hypothetical protein
MVGTCNWAAAPAGLQPHQRQWAIARPRRLGVAHQRRHARHGGGCAPDAARPTTWGARPRHALGDEPAGGRAQRWRRVTPWCPRGNDGFRAVPMAALAARPRPWRDLVHAGGGTAYRSVYSGGYTVFRTDPTVGRTLGLLARLVRGRGACTSSGRRLPDLCTRLRDGGGSTFRGHSVASGSRAFLASPWSSPAEDGDDG